MFSGIGGFALGLERVGFRVGAFCESDPFARSVLQRHWPAIPRYDDIRTLSAGRMQADGVPRPNLICGGFPCQDISPAGPGAGLQGHRSALWAEMLRLVGECRPAWVVVENVPALRVRGADEVLASLEGEGYACWPLVVGAANAGAPHRRQRVFILAHAAGARLEVRRASPAVEAPRVPAERRGRWQAQPGVRRVADGLPARLDRRSRLTALGNAIVPAIASEIGRAILHVEALALLP